MRRVLPIVVLCLVTFPAQATPCWVIKTAYAPFASRGIKAAEKWAREQGYSEAEIRDARKCLHR